MASESDVNQPPAGNINQQAASQTDRLVLFERARAMYEYSAALKQADAKALKLFDITAEHMQRQFSVNTALYSIITGIALIILIIGISVVLFVPEPSITLQNFCTIAIPLGLITLILLLYRNPIIHARHILESTLKINVIFIGFIRRVQQSDLLMQSMFYENGEVDLEKVYLLMQEFQGILDQTQQELDKIKYP